MVQWNDPVGFIAGATPPIRRAWASLGIQTVGDLLETIPRRYDDYTRIVSIRDALAGEVVTLRTTIVSCKATRSFRKRMTIVRLTVRDATGQISIAFFNQPWLIETMKPGNIVMVSGKMVAQRPYGKTLIHPILEQESSETVTVGKLAPVYGLSGTLYQKTYRRLVKEALDALAWPDDRLTTQERDQWHVVSWREAMIALHAPRDWADAEAGRKRFAFDELVTYQLALQEASRSAEAAGAPGIPFDERFARAFAHALPFSLTDDQKRAVWASLQDMGKDIPMRRLLQGDVGAGKTAVAAFLAAHVVRAGSSAAILAPTDILAQQHAATFQRLLAPHQMTTVLLTRTEKKRMTGRETITLDAKDIVKTVETGNIVLVGTHAILEAGRLPPDLALAIVDEQHRFGVEQREALSVTTRRDGRVPHFLSMTATPIPRSLALMLYGGLAVSVLREKPTGRLPIHTHVCRGVERERAYQTIRDHVARGQQAFVVCALIDPSDVLGVASATVLWKSLRAGALSGLRVGLLHGRLKPDEKDRAMKDLLEKKLDVLVATSVIEVGVDVPNATVIAIENAERFGLAQLHQMRGRVGRATLPSHCFLMTDADGESLVRLETVAREQDGFVLAEADLHKRGSGALLGTTQSGAGMFRAARLSDHRLMQAAREYVDYLFTGTNQDERRRSWDERLARLQTTRHGE